QRGNVIYTRLQNLVTLPDNYGTWVTGSDPEIAQGFWLVLAFCGEELLLKSPPHPSLRRRKGKHHFRKCNMRNTSYLLSPTTEELGGMQMKFLDNRFKTQEMLSLQLVMKLGNLLSWNSLDAESRNMFKTLLGIRQGHQRLLNTKGWI
uniref:Uncharacterized protein n=1 Tax=Bubo bubo TaxID=30461 RepID=A0A8C0F267_BUBBB